MMDENESPVKDLRLDFEAQPIDYDPQKHNPLPYLFAEPKFSVTSRSHSQASSARFPWYAD